MDNKVWIVLKRHKGETYLVDEDLGIIDTDNGDIIGVFDSEAKARTLQESIYNQPPETYEGIFDDTLEVIVEEWPFS